MRTNKFLVCTGIMLLTGAAACNADKIADVNGNPNSPTDAPAGAVFTNAVQTTVGRFLGGYSNSQTELVTQHLAQTQYPDQDRYTRLQGNDTQGNFTGPYVGELADLQKVIQKGTAQKRAGIYAPAQVITAWTYSYITDTWGDIPYSQALKADSGIYTPKYDAQKDIYTALLAALTKAAADLKADAADDPGLGSADIIYGGDVGAWGKFANSLHARLAMRLVNVDPATASAELNKAFAGGVFASNADAALLKWPGDGAFNNGWSDLFKTRDDYRMSKTLMNIMLANSDPRIPVFAQPTVADPTKYAGMPNGLDATAAGQFFNTSSRPGTIFYPGATAYGFFGGGGAKVPYYVMTYAELAFIQAEAAQRGIGGLNAGQAQGFYNAAITASLNQWGVTDAAKVSAYLAQPGVALKSGTDGLKQIAIQKWIALFTDGGQAWSEWRRTCQPTTVIAGPNAAVTFVPRRFFYAPAEVSVNQANLNEAIARQGADNFGTRIYWDTKPTGAPTCS
jgi:hypothetical protein